MICDFHTHSFLSDGSLSPLELLYDASRNNYSVIAITDHCGVGSLERIINELTNDCALARAHWDIIAIPGVELTMVPPAAIAETAKQAKEMGAQLVVVHGEAIGEVVVPGTNLAAANSAHVDILAHPGLLTLEQAQAAAANGVFIEISARRKYTPSNGYITKVIQLAGAKLLLNSDAHDEEGLLSPPLAQAIAQGSGLDNGEIEQMLYKNPSALLQGLNLR